MQPTAKQVPKISCSRVCCGRAAFSPCSDPKRGKKFIRFIPYPFGVPYFGLIRILITLYSKHPRNKKFNLFHRDQIRKPRKFKVLLLAFKVVFVAEAVLYHVLRGHCIQTFKPRQLKTLYKFTASKCIGFITSSPLRCP